DNSGRASGASLGGIFPIRQNPTGQSDWAVATATDGQALFVFGFEGFDVTATSGADTSWRLQKRSLPGAALDASFGISGSVAENPGPGLDLPFKVVVDGAFVYLVGAQETGLHSGCFVL